MKYFRSIKRAEVINGEVILYFIVEGKEDYDKLIVYEKDSEINFDYKPCEFLK